MIGTGATDSHWAKLRAVAGRKEEDSKTLRFSDELCCMPLEEVDTYHPGKTYCVITKALDQYVVHRFSTEKTLFLFSPLHPLRIWAVCMQTAPLLQYIITAGIISNCVLLTSEHAYNPSKYAFFGVFSFELLIRCISRGLLFHPHSILRIPWRWLDVLSLAGSSYDLVSGSARSIGIGASLLRTFRLFHILKTISIIPGLKVVVSSLLRSLKMVMDFFLITLFFMILFSVMGKMVFQQSLSNKCVLINSTADNSTFWLKANDEDFILCGFVVSSYIVCPENYTCKSTGPTPHDGLDGFENFWSAMFTAFRLLTLDEWEDLFDEAVSCKGGMILPYYILVVFLGSFILMNIPIAMVISAYATEVKIALEEQTIAIPDVTRYSNASEFFFNPHKLSVRIYDPERKPARWRRRNAVDPGPLAFQELAADVIRERPKNLPAKDQNEENQGLNVVDIEKEADPSKKKHSERKSLIRYSELGLRPLLHRLSSIPNLIHLALYRVVSHRVFGIISAIGISINSLILLFLRDDMDKELEQVVDRIDEIFRIIFIVEILMKIIGMGRKFLRDVYLLDLFIVSLNFFAGIQWKVKGIGIMRMWLAISDLEKVGFLRYLVMIQHVIMKSLASLVYLVLLLILTVYIFAVIGFNFFSRHYSKGDPKVSEWSFSDFTHSLLIVFRILCGEWFLPFWECYKQTKSTILCTIFFFSAVICINIVLLNIILGVLCDCFEEANAEEDEEFLRELRLAEENSKSFLSEKVEDRSRAVSRSISSPYLSDLSHKLRKFLDDDFSDLVVIIIIIISCISQCFEDFYLEESTFLWLATKFVYVTTSLFFLLEILLNFLVRGLQFKWTDWWNMMEILLSVIFVLDITIFRKRSLQSLRVIRSCRILRPFATQRKWRGIQMSASVLGRSAVSIINVLIMVLYFWFAFSVIGVSLYRGKLYRCVDEEGTILDTEVVDSKQQCLAKNYSWENNPVNFDDVGKGYLALFQLGTFEGWIEVMKAASEVRGIDLQPAKATTLTPYIYFVVFIIVGVLIALKLFVGVIVQRFDLLRKHADSGIREQLTSEFMQKYYHAMKRIARRRPQKLPLRPRQIYKVTIYDVVTSANYETVVFVVIVLYLILDLIIYFHNDIYKLPSVRIIRMIITYLFLFEACLELWVFKLLHFQSVFNCVDFFSVLVCAATTVFANPIEIFAVDPLLLRICRIIKTDRTFLNSVATKQLRRLFLTLQISLSAISNIILFLVLVMYIYAVIGMNLFGDSKSLSSVLNFESIMPSMMLLFQVSTAAGWNDAFGKVIMQDTCSLDGSNSCGHYYWATIYFCTYLVICSFILLNMFVAIVLENFNEVQESKDLDFEEEDLDVLYNLFSKEDPNGTGFIPVLQLSDFLSSLPAPFTVQKPNKVTIIVMDIPVCKGNRVHFVDLCSALFKFMLGKTSEKSELPLKRLLETRFRKVFPEREQINVIGSTKNLKLYEQSSDKSFVVDPIWAAMRIQKAWRKHRKS